MPTNHLSHAVHVESQLWGRGDRWILMLGGEKKKVLAESGSFGFSVSPFLKI